MSSSLYWITSAVSSVLSYLDGAKSQISGKSIGSPTGCSWSVTAAAYV